MDIQLNVQRFGSATGGREILDMLQGVQRIWICCMVTRDVGYAISLSRDKF